MTTTYSTVRLSRPPATQTPPAPVTRLWHPFTDEDAARAVGVRSYLPALSHTAETMTLPRLSAADIQIRSAAPEPVVYGNSVRPPRYRGRRRRPTSDRLRALILAVAFVAIAVLPGVLG